MAIRISGLASGMDIDEIVSKLMKTERVPLDKLTQKKQTLEWRPATAIVKSIRKLKICRNPSTLCSVPARTARKR